MSMLRKKREPVDRGAERQMDEQGWANATANFQRKIDAERQQAELGQVSLGLADYPMKDGKPDTSPGRAVVRPKEDSIQSNISWRAYSREGNEKFEERAPMVSNMLKTGDPAGFDVQAVEARVRKSPEMIHQFASAYMNAARSAYDRFSKDFVSQNDRGREEYILDSMAIIDRGYDDVTEKAAGPGQYDRMRTAREPDASRDKEIYMTSLEEMTHPGSISNLDGRIERVASTFERLYEEHGMTMLHDVQVDAQRLRETKSIDVVSPEPAKEMETQRQQMRRLPGQAKPRQSEPVVLQSDSGKKVFNLQAMLDAKQAQMKSPSLEVDGPEL